MSEFEKALGLLEEVVRRQGAPSHYVARHLLLALGEAIRNEEPRAAEWQERARRVGALAGTGWTEAVETELSLACAEFAQCLEPRYLSLPNYDLEYTRAARARLEDRLSAARALGLAPSPRDQEILTLADQVLEAHRTRLGPAGEPPRVSGPP